MDILSLWTLKPVWLEKIRGHIFPRDIHFHELGYNTSGRSLTQRITFRSFWLHEFWNLVHGWVIFGRIEITNLLKSESRTIFHGQKLSKCLYSIFSICWGKKVNNTARSVEASHHMTAIFIQYQLVSFLSTDPQENLEMGETSHSRQSKTAFPFSKYSIAFLESIDFY